MNYPQLIARCDNQIEQPDGTARACLGHLTFQWGWSSAACDKCGAQCGIAVANWTEVRPVSGDLTAHDGGID